MQGLMQHRSLSIPYIFERAEMYYGSREIVTGTTDGIERLTFAEWAVRTRKLASVLDRLGISETGRVATFGWNTSQHLELYFAAPCSGRVLHTLNIRLFPEQLVYIVNHAEDEIVFVDKSLVAQFWPHIHELKTVRHVVIIDDGAGEMPEPIDGVEIHEYEALLADAEPAEWPDIDENQAASMCYTSGTTGNPKGVVYTHRSTYLHTMALMMADAMAISQTDTVMPVVPMFHANAWGQAHAAIAAGANLVLPGPRMAAAQLADLLEAENVTISAGVPTIWMGVLPELEGRDVSSLRAIPCGGSSVPKSLSEGYREAIGIPILHAWGMTETSPIGTCCHIAPELADLDEDAKADYRASIGRPVFGISLRVVDAATLEPVPNDGESSGEIQVSGSWVTSGYYNDDRSSQSFTEDGWLRTGDMGAVDEHGYVRIVDRTKDVIKSGGEWVSSVELENEIMAHPAVVEAAVIGVPHDKWGERPMACVVLHDGQALSVEELHEYLDGRVVRWWFPDAIEQVDEIPKTSVGKFSKRTLRDKFAGYTL